MLAAKPSLPPILPVVAQGSASSASSSPAHSHPCFLLSWSPSPPSLSELKVCCKLQELRLVLLISTARPYILTSSVLSSVLLYLRVLLIPTICPPPQSSQLNCRIGPAQCRALEKGNIFTAPLFPSSTRQKLTSRSLLSPKSPGLPVSSLLRPPLFVSCASSVTY